MKVICSFVLCGISVASLWPPCIADADIIFLSCFFFFFMVALCNRADHIYFHPVICSFFLILFFPRLISAAADWMSAILPHMVWP